MSGQVVHLNSEMFAGADISDCKRRQSISDLILEKHANI